MPAPLDNGSRLEVVRRHQQGESLRAISEMLRLSYHTVKKVWQHWTRTGKVEPNYERAQQRGTRRYGDVYPLAVRLKRDHPRWGGQLIWLELRQQNPRLALPGVRTLQRWFREAGVQRAGTLRVAQEGFVKRGKAVHQVWAVDAKENIRLADGSGVSWLIVSDEASGAILHTTVFPPPVVESGGSVSGSRQSEDGV
jgi:Homeodomain-like domain-containing protein